MRKIDTWLFIVLFGFLYLLLFWVASLSIIPLLAPLFAASTEVTVYVVSFMISIIICFIAAFSLRSYYFLPTSLIKLVTWIVVLQFVLSLPSSFSGTLTTQALVDWLLTAGTTWPIVYASFKIADRHFTK